MDEKPMVSVCMITYNHEKFIAEAIEGVLMQETDFRVELVIGEDCSTDRTGAVIREYCAKHPDKIRPLIRNSNIGMMRNFVDTLEHCSGRYVALCEGDDYWTDSSKLQKQVSYLEANPDYSVCSHRVRVVEDGSETEELFPSEKVRAATAFEDLARGNYIPTLSCVFRNKLFGPFPSVFEQLPVGDYPLHLLNARHGSIRHFGDVMGTYRKHSGGVWSVIGQETRLTKWLGVLKACDEYFYPLGHRGFQKQIAAIEVDLCFFSFNREEFTEFRTKAFHVLTMRLVNSPRSLAALAAGLALSFNRTLAQKYIKFSKS